MGWGKKRLRRWRGVMNNKERLTYDVFHDECQEDGYWHCFIFIPKNKQNNLFSLLQKPRNNLKFDYPIHFNEIGKKYKKHNEKARLVKSWITILIYAIQQQKVSGVLYFGHNDETPIYELKKGLEHKIGCKMVIFREKDNHKKMYETMDTAKKIETTFRMGLKGGTHFLFFDEKITIGNVYIDHEEKAFRENFNDQNMLERFKEESEENIFFESDSAIMPICKKDYKKNCMISEFMQLADIAVGGMRTQKLQMFDFPARNEATFPLKDILEKEIGNFARMKESRYYKGFVLSDAWIENEKWQFDEMHIDIDQDNQQKFSSLF